MRLSPILVLVLGAAALTACGDDEPAVQDVLVEPAASGPQERIPELEQCDADLYRGLIGTPVATAALPRGEMLRVYGVTDIVSQEYLPQRTNVVVGTDGLIQQVACG